MPVLGDLGADQPGLEPADIRIGLPEHYATLAERLDLGAGQDDPGLVPLEELVVVSRAPILGDLLGSGGLGHRRIVGSVSRVTAETALAFVASS